MLKTWFDFWHLSQELNHQLDHQPLENAKLKLAYERGAADARREYKEAVERALRSFDPEGKL